MAVSYRGRPRTMPGPDGPTGWEELTDGVLVAAQPHGAPTWFPCNDRMADKATYRVTVRTDPGYRVVSNGTLIGQRRVGRRVEWVHEQSEPMATYLATAADRALRARAPAESAPAPARLAAPPARMPAARVAFADQPRMLETFAALFGPYPFDALHRGRHGRPARDPPGVADPVRLRHQPPQPALGGAAAHRPRAGPPVVRQHGHRGLAARHLAARGLRLLRRVAVVGGDRPHHGAGGGRAAPRPPRPAAAGPRAHRPGPPPHLRRPGLQARRADPAHPAPCRRRRPVLRACCAPGSTSTASASSPRPTSRSSCATRPAVDPERLLGPWLRERALPPLVAAPVTTR